MRAMVLHEARPVDDDPLSLEDLPTPEPVEGEILIRVKACGVCHTDLHTVEGELELPRLPIVPGHQIVGTVEDFGPGVTRFNIGDRAGVPWLASTCGKCEYCRRGLENLCSEIRFTGYHVNGGYAEFAVAREGFAYHMPQDFSNEEAAPLLCAGIIGFRALRLSGIRPGQRLGLYGFGGSAHIAIQIARYWGCEVYVFTRSKDHQELAKQLGAEWVGRAKDEPPARLHSAVIFAPAGPLVLDALRALDKGGTIALAGIYMSQIPQLDYPLIYGERTIRSVTASTREDARDLIRYASEIPLRTEVETFSLGDANNVLQMLKRSEINGAGVLSIQA